MAKDIANKAKIVMQLKILYTEQFSNKEFVCKNININICIHFTICAYIFNPEQSS